MNSHGLVRKLMLFQAIVFLLFTCEIFPQDSNNSDQDYQEIFGQDYDFAIKTIEKNAWWTDSLEKDGIDGLFALSIIFPELIRYSSVSDYAEVKALEVLYVQYGRDYADFSVGLFQMKPSFAEKIESDMLNSRITDKFPSLSILNPKSEDDVETRKERIIRLKDEYFQLLYLEAFFRIMDILYPDLSVITPEEKLIFYSTAYNAGYYKGEKVIGDESVKLRFYRGLIEPAEKYSYAGISLSYYISSKAKQAGMQEK
jgi:hypothetical protein